MTNASRARASPICVAAFAVMAVACSDGEAANERGMSRYPGAAGHDAIVARIDAIATAALAKGPLAGLSIAVVRGQDVIVSKGYGYADLAGKVPATADTIYDIASITKLFTAGAIMKLARREGQPGRRPGVPASGVSKAEQAKRITVRHLLSHTSGLSDYEAAQRSTGWPVAACREVRARLSVRPPLKFEPGSQWSYTNSATTSSA